jgi:hypothetical protein
MILKTENPNYFTYTTDELLIELLGGVRVDTLDRMRVTIKVSVVNRKHPKYTSELVEIAVRHNLDLYNDALQRPRSFLNKPSGIPDARDQRSNPTTKARSNTCMMLMETSWKKR